MPTVDLRPLLPPTDQNQRSTDSPVDGKPADLNEPSKFGSRLRFTGPQLANLAFVIAACVGALFSAAYLFKGDELLHEVTALPRELFSGRPAVINPPPLETQDFEPVLTGGPLSDQSPSLTNNSGDPFSSSRKLLGLDSASQVTPRPNDLMSFPFSSARQPSNAFPAGSDALSSGLMNGVAAASPQTSVATNTANTVAQTAAGTAAQAANTAATTATSRAARSANRVTGSTRTAIARSAARAASIRSARPSAFKRAMAAIARSLGGPNDGKQKVAQTKLARAQSSFRNARANRTKLANHRSSAAQRRSGVTNRTSRSAKMATKSSIRASASRKAQATSKSAARSTTMSRSAGTAASALSRGSSSSFRSVGQSGFSSSAGGFRSLGSMGGGHAFGGAGGRMGLRGGHGFGGRGR